MNIIIYDASQGLLSFIFQFAARLYKKLGWAQYAFGVYSWDQMFDILSSTPDRSIASVQYWGHGYFGTVLCNHQELNTTKLFEVSKKMLVGGSWWWRTCLSFASVEGRLFAYRCANLLGCSIIGHTYIIWLWQSGTHQVAPGESPSWPTGEGWTHDHTGRNGQWSMPWAPFTISALSRRRLP